MEFQCKFWAIVVDGVFWAWIATEPVCVDKEGDIFRSFAVVRHEFYPTSSGFDDGEPGDFSVDVLVAFEVPWAK